MRWTLARLSFGRDKVKELAHRPIRPILGTAVSSLLVFFIMFTYCVLNKSGGHNIRQGSSMLILSKRDNTGYAIPTVMPIVGRIEDHTAYTTRSYAHTEIKHEASARVR